MNATTRALLVMVLDERIRAFLVKTDPKALEQACKALLDDPTVPLDLKAKVTVETVSTMVAEPDDGGVGCAFEDLESAYD